MKLKLGYTNSRRVFNLMITGLFLALAILLGFAKPVVAAEPPDVVLELPAGIACDFALRIEIWGGTQVYKEFVDKNGNVVRTLAAGKGSELSFTNLSTLTTFSLKPNGSVSHETKNPDGTSTFTDTGHNVIILFPTDVPPGPSTIQYVGRVIYTVDTDGVFTIQQVNAKTTDICAALSE